MISNKTIVNSDAKSPLVTETVNVKKLSAIDTSLGVKVIYTQGNSSSATVSAPKDIMKYIKVKANGSTLECYVDHEYQIQSGMDRVVVKVTAPEIYKFDASTGGSIEVNSAVELSGETVEMDTSTGATISFKSLICKDLDCDSSTAGIINVSDLLCSKEVEAGASTGGVVNLSGKSSKVDYSASTGGVINSSALVAYEGEADASTGGVVNCKVASLEISTSTGGAINNDK